ncbi:probable ubiquitin-conjugating enzyme E2 23 [Triticum aestivum]|uniref:probable ubiquitin-conjugating enzyme E2 23 n=1 Tax=Triticum aestivum TaxID=4565 RepID=UPI001D0260A4|nr:probable ubiquitin-conjugating enzyme E2 23 [Triticum aestivum]
MNAVAEDAVASSTNIHQIQEGDLVRVGPNGDHGMVAHLPELYYTGQPLLPAATFRIFRVDGTMETAEARDITIIDRGYFRSGQFVVSASDIHGRVGVVTESNTTLDLVKVVSHGEPPVMAMSGVAPGCLRRVRELCLGDFVVSGPWLVQESAPPAYQDPADLTFFCSAYDCYWGVGDRCFLLRDTQEEAPKKENTMHHRKLLQLDGRRRTRQRQPVEVEQPMSVASTRTTVDVLWQDGTSQSGVPSTALLPYQMTSEHEFFPGFYVVDGVAPAADAVAVVDDATEQTTEKKRVGVVRCVNSEDQTVGVSWLTEATEIDTLSAYDLALQPGPHVFYGRVVVRRPPSGCPPDDAAATDLSWVGHVVDLVDGRVQVKWADNTVSLVLPHEISIVTEQYFWELEAEMGGVGDDWVEVNSVDDECEDEDSANSAYNELQNPPERINVQGDIDSATEEDDDSVDEDDSAATKASRKGAIIEYMSQLGHQVLAQTMRYFGNRLLLSSLGSELAGATANEGANVAVTDGHHSTSNHDVIHAMAAALTSSDTCTNDDDCAERGKNIEQATGDEDQFRFPYFDVTHSPLDHHYIDNAGQGTSGGKRWVKAVQKEWKILENNNLPDTIYVRVFEDRMDLLRAVIVGASGTPYHDGLFFFDLHLPPSYPDMPPMVYYHSFGLRLNPNLYNSGTVCLSLLNTFGGEASEVWSPSTSSLLQAVVSIQGLILNDQPYYNEVGYQALVDKPEGCRNALPYNENAYLLTLWTMIHLFRRPPCGFEGFIKDHFCRRGRFILRACEAYLRGCVVGMLDGDACATKGSKDDRSCSAGLRLALSNMLPKLVAALAEIGAEGCECDQFHELHDLLIGGDRVQRCSLNYQVH